MGTIASAAAMLGTDMLPPSSSGPTTTTTTKSSLASAIAAAFTAPFISHSGQAKLGQAWPGQAFDSQHSLLPPPPFAGRPAALSIVASPAVSILNLPFPIHRAQRQPTSCHLSTQFASHRIAASRDRRAALPLFSSCPHDATAYAPPRPPAHRPQDPHTHGLAGPPASHHRRPRPRPVSSFLFLDKDHTRYQGEG